MNKIPMGQSVGCAVNKYIGSDFDHVINVSENMEHVETVSENITDVVTVAGNIDNINHVADNLENYQIDEVIVLGTNQQVVKFKKLFIPMCRFSISGQMIDGTDLFNGEDYIVENNTTIKLLRTYPKGTILKGLQAIYDTDEPNIIIDDGSAFNRKIQPLVDGESFTTYEEDGRTLTPRLYVNKKQYVPTFDLSNGITFTSGIVTDNGDGTITVSTTTGGKVFSCIDAEAVNVTYPLTDDTGETKPLVTWFKQFVSFMKNLGKQLITSKGSITPRSLEDRFAEVVNVKDFGAKGDGIADDTVAIQSALNAVMTNGGICEFPFGSYYITKPLRLRGREWSILGNNSRIIKDNDTTTGQATTPSFGGDMVTDINCFFFGESTIAHSSIKNLRLWGPSNDDQKITGFLFPSANNMVFERIQTNWCKNHWHIGNMWMSTYIMCRANLGLNGWFYDPARTNGTQTQTATSTNFINCYANTVAGTGFHLERLNYSSLSGCGSDQAGGYQYHIMSSSGIVFNGCAMERTATIGIQIQNSNGISFNGFNPEDAVVVTSHQYIDISNSKVNFQSCHFRNEHTAFLYASSNSYVTIDNCNWWNGSTEKPATIRATSGSIIALTDKTGTEYYTDGYTWKKANGFGDKLDEGYGTDGYFTYTYGAAKFAWLQGGLNTSFVIPRAQLATAFEGVNGDGFTGISFKVTVKSGTTNGAAGAVIMIDSSQAILNNSKQWTFGGHGSKLAIVSVTNDGANIIINTTAVKDYVELIFERL